jgi:hypothetical protein
MLARFASRAPACDLENRFVDEDFEELRAAKYLLLPLPSEFGGAAAPLIRLKINAANKKAQEKTLLAAIARDLEKKGACVRKGRSLMPP